MQKRKSLDWEFEAQRGRTSAVGGLGPMWKLPLRETGVCSLCDSFRAMGSTRRFLRSIGSKVPTAKLSGHGDTAR
jgi:hypothetical protein